MSSGLLGACISVVVIGIVYSHVVPEDEKAIELGMNLSREAAIANKMLRRSMDLAYEIFRELGGSDSELKELQHKRSIITRCYFQAITCY